MFLRRRSSQDATPFRARLVAAATRTAAALRAFGGHQGGQIAIIFAVSALTLTTAVGAGVDLSRMFVARQQLSHAATLTCQYSARPSVVAVAYQNGSGTATYIAQVNTQAANFVRAQSASLTQTNASPFSYTMGGSSSVSMAATVPTLFMGLAGVQTLPVAATVSCANGLAQPDDTHPSVLVHESFENSACTGTCWSSFAPNGSAGINASVASSTPTNAASNKYGYTGQSGNQWTIMGYCLEIDHSGVIKNTVADGNYSAELDCDNGSGTAGNSSISTKEYLSPGSYELRYNYSGRIGYPNYSPTVICGTTATDLAWANDTKTTGANALRTNQINVYLDQDTTGVPPTHTTLDGTQTLGGANLIDECVYSDNWVERSVKITVTTAGYYWLSFAADGANDSYGGQVDNIRLCQNTCSGTVADNFPSAWTSAPLLFEDTFESPTYTNQGGGRNSTGVLTSSYGTSNGGAGDGWPQQAGGGWAVAGYNQVDYLVQSSAQGNQSVELDGALGGGQTTSNRYAARYFYLDPGYYQITYWYVADATINGASSTYCSAAPTNLSIYTYNASLAEKDRLTQASGNLPADTNALAVMMSNSQLNSYPNINTTLNGAATYTNPDGSVTSSPTAPPDALNLSTFNGTQSNAVIDFCFFSPSWTQRTAYVRVTKPAQYWLLFAAKGTADGVGAAIDDVKVTAMNSLYGSAPPSAYVTLATAGPTPGSSISYTGFSIIADPLTP